MIELMQGPRIVRFAIRAKVPTLLNSSVFKQYFKQYRTRSELQNLTDKVLLFQYNFSNSRSVCAFSTCPKIHVVQEPSVKPFQSKSKLKKNILYSWQSSFIEVLTK